MSQHHNRNWKRRDDLAFQTKRALSRTEPSRSKIPEISVEIRQKQPENPSFYHRFVTTADAKIPLSVVRVKREPQYVVFCAP